MSLDQELLAQIDKYKEIMQKDPNSREFLTLADLYRKLGVAEEATNILRDGLKKHPDYVDARLAVARIYLTQGQVADATREFEEVIRQDVRNFVAYKLLGEIAMQKQEHEKAADRFGAAYKLKPDDQECKVMLDYIGSLLGRDVIPKIGAEPTPRPEKKAPAPVVAPGETVAVAPAGEFEEFEAIEEVEGLGELEEAGEPFEEIEEFAEVEEFGDIDELEALEDVEDIEEIGEIEEFAEEVPEMPGPAEIEEEGEIFEEEVIEEVVEEPSEVGDFDLEEFAEQELEVVEEGEEEFAEIGELEVGELETVEEEPLESLEEPTDGEEELVAQIFQELSDSKYTSETNGGTLDSTGGELEDLMGLLESEEGEEIGADLSAGESEEEVESLEEAKDDLEGMIDLEGVPGIEEMDKEEVSVVEEIEAIEEIEEFEDIGSIEEEVEGIEEIEEIEATEESQEIGTLPEELVEEGEASEEFEELQDVEEFEEIEEPDVAEEQAESSEKSSIFQDFGLPGEEEGAEETKEGDVFQDFDFDVFEQELLKDHPSQEIPAVGEEPGQEEIPLSVEDVSMEVGEESAEIVEELPEAVEELEEFGEAETLGTEGAEEHEETAGEGELPATSLAELYIKQDLFDEATNIYRKILRQTPSDKMIRQMLEETLALRAYVDGIE